MSNNDVIVIYSEYYDKWQECLIFNVEEVIPLNQITCSVSDLMSMLFPDKTEREKMKTQVISMAEVKMITQEVAILTKRINNVKG